MSIICPTVLARDEPDYRAQLERLIPFAKRIQVDLKDGDFAPDKNIGLNGVWLPTDLVCDIHLMYRHPERYIDVIEHLDPNMVIVHAESEADIPKLAAELRVRGIKTGLAILQATEIADIAYLLPHVQHLLIFSGDLGHFGGTADLTLTSKISEALAANRHLEIGWDGGVSIDNCAKLAEAGVDVLNVGGALHNSANPETTYATMVAKVTSDKNVEKIYRN